MNTEDKEVGVEGGRVVDRTILWGSDSHVVKQVIQHVPWSQGNGLNCIGVGSIVTVKQRPVF